MRVPVRRASTAAAVALVAAGLAAWWLSPEVRGAVARAAGPLTAGDPREAVQALRAWLLACGAWAPLASAALMVLQAVVAPLPAFVITFANGLVFGWARGALLSWTSAMAGAALCFWLARALGRPAVERLLGGAAALEAADRFFARHGDRAILVARLLPFVPFDPVSYGAGLTAVGWRPFLVATGLGQLPATLLYSWLGERLAAAAPPLLWLAAGVAALALLGAAWRGRRADPTPAGGAGAPAGPGGEGRP